MNEAINSMIFPSIPLYSDQLSWMFEIGRNNSEEFNLNSDSTKRQIKKNKNEEGE